MVQTRVCWAGASPLITQAVPVWLSIDQLTPEPVGSGSLMVTPVAVPVPAASLLLAVAVNPIVLPASTSSSSAVLVTSRSEQSSLVVALAIRVGALLAVSVAVFG